MTQPAPSEVVLEPLAVPSSTRTSQPPLRRMEFAPHAAPCHCPSDTRPWSPTVTDKKAWTKPELIVLVRGRPEEAVLGACKTLGGAGGDSTAAGGCAKTGCSPTCDSRIGS